MIIPLVLTKLKLLKDYIKNLHRGYAKAARWISQRFVDSYLFVLHKI